MAGVAVRWKPTESHQPERPDCNCAVHVVDGCFPAVRFGGQMDVDLTRFHVNRVRFCRMYSPAVPYAAKTAESKTKEPLCGPRVPQCFPFRSAQFISVISQKETQNAAAA
jgi:hypothetical protein